MITANSNYRDALNRLGLFDDQKAIEILSEEKLSNDAHAMYLLGQIYFFADKRETGVCRDLPKAKHYWLKAIKLGSAEAAYDLGKMYRFASGVKQSYSKAEHYWLMAFERGYTLAAFDLIRLYYDHLHEKINKAIELCLWLIENNEFVGNCCLILGRIYYRGVGVSVDREQAFLWLTKGADIGHGVSCMDLAMMYYKGECVEKDIEKAISLVEEAGKTEWLKEEAPIIVGLMRYGKLA
ncbi:MAG: tetratricopeptide repeat protein [Thiobacillus sp.]